MISTLMFYWTILLQRRETKKKKKQDFCEIFPNGRSPLSHLWVILACTKRHRFLIHHWYLCIFEYLLLSSWTLKSTPWYLWISFVLSLDPEVNTGQDMSPLALLLLGAPAPPALRLTARIVHAWSTEWLPIAVQCIAIQQHWCSAILPHAGILANVWILPQSLIRVL